MLLNIFSVHYFLWFAALTSIYGYYSSYAEVYANASASQYGLLNMLLPFASIIAKIFFCSLADRHRAYRSFFIWFLVAALVGFGSFAVMPIFVKPQSKEAGLNMLAWVLICIMISVSTISMSVISCLSDSFAMNSSIKNRTSYGLIRLWGTLGWGVSSIVLMFINNYKGLPLLVPGLILMTILLIADILAQYFWPYKEDYELDKSVSDSSTFDFEVQTTTTTTTTNQNHNHNQIINNSVNTYGTTTAISNDTINVVDMKTIEKISSIKIQWLLFKEVAKRRKSLFHYMIIFTFSGALISLQWSYFFVYLNRIYKDEFAFITALSMVGQSFIGELPFFILSKYVVKLFGKSNTLSLTFVALGVRYLLYEYLLPNSSMYFVLLTEAFQGPSFGLFYVVMTEVGLDYSDCESAIMTMVNKGVVPNKAEDIDKLRQALRATMQSLMSACYEGLGLGIGSIIGGLVIDNYNFSTLWFWSSFIAITLGLVNTTVQKWIKF